MGQPGARGRGPGPHSPWATSKRRRDGQSRRPHPAAPRFCRFPSTQHRTAPRGTLVCPELLSRPHPTTPLGPGPGGLQEARTHQDAGGQTLGVVGTPGAPGSDTPSSQPARQPGPPLGEPSPSRGRDPEPASTARTRVTTTQAAHGPAGGATVLSPAANFQGR